MHTDNTQKHIACFQLNHSILSSSHYNLFAFLLPITYPHIIITITMLKLSTLAYRFARNKRMIAGNWKSNKTQSEAIDFVNNTINKLSYNHNNVGTHTLKRRRYYCPHFSTHSNHSRPQPSQKTALPSSSPKCF